jgi:plasmid stabilization system protein ParE
MVGRPVVFYRLDEAGVFIVRVLHGGMDVKTRLDAEA